MAILEVCGQIHKNEMLSSALREFLLRNIFAKSISEDEMWKIDVCYFNGRFEIGYLQVEFFVQVLGITENVILWAL